MATITSFCHTQSHDRCDGYVQRVRPGVLPGVRTIDHPNPDPGESLQMEHARCMCPCHPGNYPKTKPALPPGKV